MTAEESGRTIDATELNEKKDKFEFTASRSSEN